jgi:adenylosuccinate lyase
MRRYGISDAYEQLKTLTRGQAITTENLKAFVHTVDIPDDARQRLLDLAPSDYVGVAADLARDI